MIAILGSKIPVERLVTRLKSKNIDAVMITSSLHDLKFKKKIKTHEIIHFIGSPTVTIHGIITLLRFKLWGKKIVVSWRGSDVMIANNHPIFKKSSRFLQSLIDSNNSLSVNLQKELDSIKVRTKLQPNPTFTQIYELKDLPKTKKIVVYLPDKMEYQWDFYQGEKIKKIIKDFPEVEFLIIGNSGKRFDEKNVKCFEWVEDMEKIYESIIGVIRIPKHDGLSNVILEATSMGRTVIASSIQFPFCKIANSYEELVFHLKEIIDNPTLNIEGSRYVHDNFDEEVLLDQLIEMYKTLN
jgi:glycosyltransferase involved in cell wall biosynthesis